MVVAFLAMAHVAVSCSKDDRERANANSRRTDQHAVATIDRASIYDRALESFAEALFYKPLDDSAPERIVQLAPLIVQEVPTSQPVPDGVRLLPVEKPVVHYRESHRRVAGRERAILEFHWRCGSKAGDGRRSLLMVFGKDGFPVIQAVRDGAAGPVKLFASKSLEDAALAAHGRPLDGNRFAVEGPRRGDDDPIVVRILDDGPMPMGPFVYLTGEDATVTTLLCRCMASQVSTFTESNYYELRPIPTPRPDEVPDLVPVLIETVGWLRLPVEF